MKIRLYLDEDAEDDDLVQALRLRGVDTLTTQEASRLETQDADQLAWATLQGRVIYTFNVKDFYQLHTVLLSQGGSHAGMILAPQRRYPVGEQMRRLLRLMAALSADDMRNRAEFLSAWN